MSIIGSNILAGASGQGGGYTIERSLRFRSSASAYLSRTPASAGNRKTWTWSGWVKRGQLGTGQLLLGIRPTSSPYFFFGFLTNTTADQLVVTEGSSNFYLASEQVFRDPSAWYHIILAVDTTQATSTDRIKMYVNGSQITSLGATQNYGSLNFETQVNTTTQHNIGSALPTTTNYFDGYLTEVNFIDGQALDPSSFGEYNADTGVWQPIKYVGTYGTNGFYLPFSDNTTTTTLVADSSGNSNDWTPNNISLTSGVTYDSMTDTPTPYADGGNYAVLNPLKQGSAVTVSNGNLRAVGTGAAWGTVLSSIGMTSGKWYCEVTVTANSNSQMFGICQETATLTTHVGASSVGYGYYAGGDKYNNGVPVAYGASYTANDVIGIAYDADAGSLTFYKNNASQGVAYSGLSTTATWFFAVSAYNTNNTNDINFGQRPFAYTPPTGFLPLHTGNLPDSAIVDGSEYFNTVLYTGNISGASVTGVGFQPDFVWAKNRSAVNNHELIDAVRGGSSALFSNVTNAEATQQRISSFDSDGWTYTINSNSALANPYVGWTWKANGAGVSNTDGSITSTVSANPTAGFSIVTYTGTGANATVGHGLGVAPKLILFKNRASTNAWCVYHSSISPANFLQFDTSAKLSATTYPMFGTTPTAATSTVFSIGTNPQTNAASTFVAYCFAEVEGYSKFGSYTGNGSADGTFVYTGFRPRWLLIKNTTGYSWILKDTARDTRNVAGFTLVPNASAADSAAGNNPTDFLSNGFKLREGSVSINSSGTTYIYMAFAENPFKNSLAR